MGLRVFVVGSAAALALLIAGCNLFPLNDSFDFDANAYDYTIGDLALGVAFPPNANTEQRDFTVEQLNTLSINRIRIGQAWELREPARDQFNWEPLDARMDRFRDEGIDLFITLEMKNMPGWLEGLTTDEREAEFREYVEAFLERYGADVEFIQFGNEWNWEIDKYLHGDDAEFTRFANLLYSEVMQLRPDARPTVVLGSVAIGGLRGLAFAQDRLENVYFDGGPLYGEDDLEAADQARPEELPRYRDIVAQVGFEAVDLHLYDDYWNWETYRDAFGELLSKAGKELGDYRLLASEFGGPHPDLESPDAGYKADRVVSYVQALDEIGVEIAYYFKLVEEEGADIAHPNSFLIDKDLERVPAFEVMKRFGARSIPL